jgi:hypothetical protein
VAALVEFVPAVPGHPLRRHRMRRRRCPHLLHQILVGLDLSAVSAALRAGSQNGDHVLAVGDHRDRTRPFERLQTHQNGRQLHAVVGGPVVAAHQDFFPTTRLHHGTAAAWSGIAPAAAVTNKVTAVIVITFTSG